jgi:pyocin large subunit-like protein
VIRTIGAIIGALILAWTGLQWYKERSETLADSQVTALPAADPIVIPASPGPDPPRPAPSSVGFRSRERLEEHYHKHGAEFGRIGIEEYLHRAQALRDAAVGGDVLEVIRPTDGVVSRFDRASGAFLAFDSGGTIRTFFKPNDGEAYFRRQAKRRPSQ